MTDEHSQVPSTGDQSVSSSRYTAEVGQDPALQTTTLSLSSTDRSNSSRNTLVCIAPEFGSNLFRFRVGEHDLIYTDQQLLKKRDYTGNFVLWPFPNRVRDKRYTYQVHNKSTRALPFGFALHPYFSTFADKHDVFVSIPAQAVMEADDEMLPTGRIFDVRKVMYAMYDLREPTPIACLKLDHVYTRLSQPALSILDYKKFAMQLHISATDDFTHLVIFTPEQVPSLCIEYQTCSTDAINLHHQSTALREIAHLLEIQPGETYSGAISYSVVFTA